MSENERGTAGTVDTNEAQDRSRSVHDELHLAYLFIAKKQAEVLQKIAELEAERAEIDKAVEVCRRFGLFPT